MLNNWQACKNILCIRPDNMGDLVMTGPALRALKEAFGAKITVLTSSIAAGIAPFMPEIDEVMEYDLPWVKTGSVIDPLVFNNVIAQLKERQFDAAVIFTVYSQNPLPAVMLAYLAGIPNRLAYCRENPYQLLTHWVPDKEPYSEIKHQVQRDLDLVKTIGATTHHHDLYLQVNPALWNAAEDKLTALGFDPGKKWLILHAGVSEVKRSYSKANWIKAAKQLINYNGYQVVLTGSASEKQLTDELEWQIGAGAFSTGGLFRLEELIALINRATIMVTVNTGTTHIAAAVKTPVVVLYALTNPQHTPWQSSCMVLPYQVPGNLHSKNEVINYVNQFFYSGLMDYPGAVAIVDSVIELSDNPAAFNNQQLCIIKLMEQVIGTI
ncbi:glycosyltransferase family 9 protein [Mucilaginibacter sp.]|uniref:glycosyltransferase family 9 protein n=1 Tax=Mucilaginibacter sp. TaxID=1882438 RepID=UPI0026154402|nr:glycosyltransferase family 9 protein [Mucilaginibacter sp.]MDB4926649.1 glycosyl transferase family 9 [Mucilaginibacter sp.]